jgi:hypothetical protein
LSELAVRIEQESALPLPTPAPPQPAKKSTEHDPAKVERAVAAVESLEHRARAAAVTESESGRELGELFRDLSLADAREVGRRTVVGKNRRSCKAILRTLEERIAEQIRVGVTIQGIAGK